VLAVCWATASEARDLDREPLVRALRAELARSVRIGLPGMPRPHYVGYTVLDSDRLSLSAEFGGLVLSDRQRHRHLRADVRVGSAAVDNSLFLQPGLFSGRQHKTWFPLEDDEPALRWNIWLTTDDAYKAAVETLQKKRAHLASNPRDADHPGDFSAAPAARGERELAGAAPDRARWEGILRRLTAAYREFPDVQAGDIQLDAQTLRRHLVSSEGALAYESRSVVALRIGARTQADDGMVLRAASSIAAPSADALPKEEALAAEVRRLLRELVDRRAAPLGKDYSGPVLFEGDAAAQVLRALLVPHLSGTPPATTPWRTIPGTAFEGLTDRVVMSPAFTVVDDPTLESWRSRPLVGRYHLDDEGVVGQRVKLIDRGKLKTFLMSRTPRKGVPSSNGHGRYAFFGHRGAISNLVVSAKGVPRRELIRRLLAEAKKRGEQHALVVRELAAGSCTPFGCSDAGGRIVAARVDADGRETLLRGLRLHALPVSALRQIVAAGDRPLVHNDAGLSRWSSAGYPATPTSVVTPALLFSDVQIMKVKSTRRALPLLPSPPSPHAPLTRP
jgi:hypothetical protein